MTGTVIWRPEPLTARLEAAALKARVEWANLARSRCSSKRVASSIAVLGDRVALDPLAGIIEGGAKPHEIEPSKKKALKFADGSFATTAQHPGSPAKPFMRPTLPFWAPLYRRAASGAFRGF